MTAFATSISASFRAFAAGKATSALATSTFIQK
jgi:hypothetical protein